MINKYKRAHGISEEDAVRFQKNLHILDQYRKIVSLKLDDFMAEYNKDFYEMAWLCRLRWQTIADIYWCEESDMLKLAHVSACIDAIRHNRYEKWWTWSLFGPVSDLPCDYRDAPEYFLYRE